MRAGAALLGSLVAALLAAPPAVPAATATTAATAATRTVLAAGSPVGYRVIGPPGGRPLVLLTGLGGSMDTWDPVFVDELAAPGRRVVLMDNEGVGLTRLRPGTLTVERMADGVAAFIRRLRLRRPDVVAWSLGGMVAQSLCVRYPRLVRRLVLMGTAPGDGKATLPPPEAGQALIGGDAMRLLALMFPPGAEAFRDGFLADLGERSTPLVLPSRDTILAQFNAAAGWLFGTDLAGKEVRRLRQPVLIGSGAKDVLLPSANQRHLARIIPRAKLVTYPDAGHGFFIQHEEDWLGRLDEFLGP